MDDTTTERLPIGMTLNENTGVMNWYGVNYYSDVAKRGRTVVACDYCFDTSWFPTQDSALDPLPLAHAGWEVEWTEGTCRFACPKCSGR